MIEARGLTKKYGSTTAVQDLSFSVAPGKVTGFLGPNGAGKSTTMRMVLGLDRPTAGEVTVGGKRYADLEQPLQTVGSLLDATWVHPNRSASAHLRWVAATNGLPRRRVDEVLELVGLSQVAGKRAGGFSLGMSQRLGIATALLGDPRVLMFDEPVNGLDPEGIVWVRTFMKAMAAEGRTVFVSSHLLSEMAQTATDLIVIGRGRLIAQTTTEQFIKGAGVMGVRVRSPQLDQLVGLLREHDQQVQVSDGAALVQPMSVEQIGELAAAHRLVLHELAPQQASLEQAFMEITGQSVDYSAGPPKPSRASAPGPTVQEQP